MTAAVGLRADFDAGALWAAARRSKDGPQARRLLALAAIYNGATRTEAAQIGGVGLQVIRDWVLKFKAHGPDGLSTERPRGSRRGWTTNIARRWRRFWRAGQFRRFMGSWAGGSSISAKGFSRGSVSPSPGRRWAACCARWDIASSRLALAIMTRPPEQSRR